MTHAGLIQVYLIGLNFEDALYFAIVTCTTVGFGDIYPVSAGAQAFTLFFATIGILMVGFTIRIARDTILESFENSYRLRRQLMSERSKERRRLKKELHEQRLRRQKEREELGITEDAVPEAPKIGGGRGGAAGQATKLSQSTRPGVSAGKAWLARTFGKHAHRYVVQPGDNLLVKVGILQPRHLRSEGSLGLRRTVTEQSLTVDSAYSRFKRELKQEEQRELFTKMGISVALFVVFWMVRSQIHSVG